MAQRGGTFRIAAGIGTDVTARSDVESNSLRDGSTTPDHETLADEKGAEKGISGSTEVVRRSEPSSLHRHPDGGTSDDRQWELVTASSENHDEDGERHSQDMQTTQSWSSQFDFKLGWGAWKFTLFSWDINFKRSESGH
ncbi:hypothetical protein B0H67DRAFT_588791 [Lasiosphaeris hirsuta]|uniref:Uncharacterized protein n=1 Tax=Lasiosphaeris hirsuta TaxID=260670 RepID=A0AA40DNN8_9PEZI|nr:hypothetical protein B0H67DRAFT_588791 [Lasiosphaeris hirsuta]